MMMERFAERTGERILNAIRYLGGIALMARQIFQEAVRPPMYLRLIMDQIYHIGIQSQSLIYVAAASTGMVMVLQFGLGLGKFGGKLYVPKIVSLSILREMGPVFCSLMFAARVGAGIASEIGSMVVTQQIDAIRALGTSPIKRIVIPKIIASTISLPILVNIGSIISISAGCVVGIHELGLDPEFYVQKVLSTITISDYLVGLGKTFCFAIMISTTACFCGLTVSHGTRGVGMATTKSVVLSSILVVVGDFFLTKLFFVLFES